MKLLFKTLLIIFVLFYFAAFIYGQQEMSKPKSVYDKFLSNVGAMITKDFYDYTTLESKQQNLQVQIIKLTSNKKEMYFISITAFAKYADKVAIISLDDLNEISKALKSIIEKSKEELKINLEHRERYFVTNDGFKIGYVQTELKQTFFIDLDDYQSEDTYFFENFDPLINTIEGAKTKIENLNKKK